METSDFDCVQARREGFVDSDGPSLFQSRLLFLRLNVSMSLKSFALYQFFSTNMTKTRSMKHSHYGSIITLNYIVILNNILISLNKFQKQTHLHHNFSLCQHV